MGQSAGHTASVGFKSGELVDAWSDQHRHRVKASAFNRKPGPGMVITPHAGRFYPQGWVANIPSVFTESMQPGRLVSMDSDEMIFDFNHPMAGQDVELGVEIHHVGPVTGEHGGRCSEHLMELMHGPGMQARYNGVATDFFTADAFTRMDNQPDSAFYSLPRMVPHLDAMALQQVEKLYQRLIPEQSDLLDLMASWDSHLPESMKLKSVIGVGLNEDELKANRRLDDYVMQDINRHISLPFADASFDTVISSVSVEYLTQPVDTFKEVARILKPGGLFINTFSNRWFPTKAIALWCDLHEFERLGLVTEYYLQSEGFRHIHTHSLRGYPRPEDDKHAGKSLFSDPVYAVWASRI